MRINGTARKGKREKKLQNDKNYPLQFKLTNRRAAGGTRVRVPGYFEWDRSETIFGNFSENVVRV